MTAISSDTVAKLDDLVRANQADVWRYLRYLGANHPEAEDLTQETFLAVARSSFLWRSQDETNAYLRTVARNQLLMLRRKQKREVSTTGLDAAESVWAEAIDDDGGFDAYLEVLSHR